jgi:hypothetical protein
VEKNATAFEAVKRYIREKWKDLLVIGLLAVGLLFAVSRVFRDDEPKSVSTQMTETELKVSRLLQEIQGVGTAEVIVCETEDGEILGVVTDVNSLSSDIYTIEKAGKKILFPAVKKVVKKVDLGSGKLIVDKKIFDEIAVY